MSEFEVSYERWGYDKKWYVGKKDQHGFWYRAINQVFPTEDDAKAVLEKATVQLWSTNREQYLAEWKELTKDSPIYKDEGNV